MIFLSKNSSPPYKPILFTFYLILFTLSFFFLSCEKSTASLENKTPNISLEVDEVAVTEVWLNLNMENMLDKDVLRVYQDDSVIYTGKPGPADTTLYDNGLLPAHSYSYHASLARNNQVISEINSQSITTMDTTSHDFKWEITTIESPFGSGMLFDAAIINENDIWAVGEIYSDSTQPSKRYNAVHWNGIEWELKRIPYVYNGQPYYHPLNFSFSFENGEVWFGGNGIVKWDGNNYTNVEINQNVWGPVSINKIWGSSTSNVFIVGNEGSMAHYNGSSWQKLESGTDLNIYDIWGEVNPFTGKNEILAIASSWPQSLAEVKLLRIENHLVYPVSVAGLPIAMTNFWFMPGKRYYLVGDGVYYTRKLGEPWVHDPDLPLIFKSGIRGHDINDIFIVGGFGLVSHFNGMSWHNYSGNELPYFNGVLGSPAYKGNIVVAVGWRGVDGVILVGHRK
jgi:hypothetical protein